MVVIQYQAGFSKFDQNQRMIFLKMKKNTWDETCLMKVVEKVLAGTMQFFIFKVYMYSLGGFRKEGFFRISRRSRKEMNFKNSYLF